MAAAIHAGHDVRPRIAEHLAIGEAHRLREEDPFTDRLANVTAAKVVARRSRFEVDLNRPRPKAVYLRPEDAWGIAVWDDELPPRDVDESLTIYDAFYRRLAGCLESRARRGGFVVLDVHSYNFRRRGPLADDGSPADNPEVNVGTGSLDRSRWGGLVDTFVRDLGRQEVLGHRLDVRENVRFTGGHLSRWVHERYGRYGCALAIEFRKSFMDEWTGEVDEVHLGALTTALRATVPGLVTSLRGITGR